MQHFTREALAEAVRAWCQEEGRIMAARPAGLTRSTWRARHPIALPASWPATLDGAAVMLQAEVWDGRPYQISVIRRWTERLNIAQLTMEDIAEIAGGGLWTIDEDNDDIALIQRSEVLETIDLKSGEADALLARYVPT